MNFKVIFLNKFKILYVILLYFIISFYLKISIFDINLGIKNEKN